MLDRGDGSLEEHLLGKRLRGNKLGRLQFLSGRPTAPPQASRGTLLPASVFLDPFTEYRAEDPEFWLTGEWAVV